MQLQEDIYTSGGVQTHTLWASLRNDTADTDRPENHQRNTLTVLDRHLWQKKNKSGVQKPL